MPVAEVPVELAGGAAGDLRLKERDSVLGDEDPARREAAAAPRVELGTEESRARPDRVGRVGDDHLEPLGGLRDVPGPSAMTISTRGSSNAPAEWLGRCSRQVSITPASTSTCTTRSTSR